MFTKEKIEKNLENLSDGQKFNDLMDYFKIVNPAYYKLFGNKTQREALDRLVKNFGYEKIKSVIKALPQVNSIKYAPIATTPLELENKLGKIIAFMAQQKNTGKGKGIIR